jgi:hypothetical protein
VLLTIPLLAFAAARQRPGLPFAWVVSRPLAALAAGVLVWAVPLLAASGGIAAYAGALGGQAGEDFAAVDMLWSNPTPRRLALSLYEAFFLPWGSVLFGALICILAAGGAAVSWFRERRAIAVLVVAFGPYAVFHLLLQETFTVRYALPILPPVAWLAMQSVMSIPRIATPAAVGLIAASGVTAVPAGIAYAREAHPAFRAIRDMEAASAELAPARVYSHYALRRALQAAPPGAVHVVDPQPRVEWLSLVKYWLDGGRAPVWFLADPRRTDLALIDPAARDIVSYDWAVADRLELAGTRPLGADWYRFGVPGWFAAGGWALTPETGGVATAAGLGPHRKPIEAFIRRQPGPVHAMVGGGYVGDPAGVPVAFDLAIDGRPIESWTLEPGATYGFLRQITLPDGVPAGDGDYARLTIAARAALAGAAIPPVAVREFDLQPASKLIYGFGDGWHQEEYDYRTGRRWRWTSGRAVLHVAPPRAVRLRLRGESPLRYFNDAPLVRIAANGQPIAILRPDDDFLWQVIVPAAEVQAAGGTIVLETDRVFMPAERGESADRRRLGLRILEIDVHPVEP